MPVTFSQVPSDIGVPLTYFEFVDEHLNGTATPAKIKEIDSFTDKELLIELSRRGYLTITEYFSDEKLYEAKKSGRNRIVCDS